MKIYINHTLTREVHAINVTEYEDLRRYYDLRGALVVCRNGLELSDLAGYVVDANVGWDIAQKQFVADESRIGEKRLKITIYRRLYTKRYHRTLLSIIEE